MRYMDYRRISLNRRRENGFTIVETMIVLAIAGLILLLMLLAIPTLVRSSRNDQRRQDVQAVLQAVSHYELNNSGNMPSSATPVQLPRLSYYGSPTINYSTPVSCNLPNSGFGIAFCTSGNWTDAPNLVSNSLSNKLDTILIYNHEKCDPAHSGQASRTGAGFSDVVALYAIETGSGVSLQCQQL